MQAEPTPEPPPEAEAVPEPDPAAEAAAAAGRGDRRRRPQEVAVETPLPRVAAAAAGAGAGRRRSRNSPTRSPRCSTRPSRPRRRRRRTQPATIGAVTGSPFTQLRQNEIDALRARLAACWDIPPTRVDPAELRVKVKVFLGQDGTLTREPEVVEYRPSQIGQVAAESAIRAVKRCAPFTLPPEKYDSWKEIIMTFDPREMFGG